jgi:hypothetical protein
MGALGNDLVHACQVRSGNTVHSHLLHKVYVSYPQVILFTPIFFIPGVLVGFLGQSDNASCDQLTNKT